MAGRGIVASPESLCVRFNGLRAARFPTLLRTTGAGFCYNFGRVMAAIGTLLLAPQAAQMDYRMPMVYVALVYIPGLILAFLIPEPSPSFSHRREESASA